jgi:hypothetical protein
MHMRTADIHWAASAPAAVAAVPTAAAADTRIGTALQPHGRIVAWEAAGPDPGFQALAADGLKWRRGPVIRGVRRSAAGSDRPDRVPAWRGRGERAWRDVLAAEQRVSVDNGPAGSGPADNGPA